MIEMDLRMEDKLSNEDFTVTKHAGLLRNSASIYGKSIQRIQPPGRNEPSLEVSEFHLNDKRKVNITKTLSSSIDKTGQHVNLTTKVKKAQKLIKTLPTPLDHPKGEKIKRTVAFEAAKSILTRWVPLINANKVTDCLEFPLNTPYFKTQSSESFLSKMKAKTPLEQEVEKMLSDSVFTGREKEKIAKKATFFLNRKEIMEQTRELARIRAQQSYREAKARRQNKIKSKKYHRILNRSNTRKQIQEFKELQKRDPEAAIKKLEELEKTRAEERVTLRHRSTGQWARNKTVRAKFKDCREQLEQQLRLGRDLKERLNVRHDSDDEDIGDDEQCVHENNPWMNKKDGEYKKFVNGYNVFCDLHKLRKTKDQEKLDKVSHVEDIGDDEQCVHENNPWMNKKDGEHKEFVNGYNLFCDQHKLRKTKDQEKLDKVSHVEDIGDDEQCVHENNPWMNKKDGEHKEFVNGYNVFCDQHKLRKTKDQEKLDKASHVEDIGDDEQCVHENNPWMNKKDGEHKEFVNGYNVFCDQHKLRKTKDQEKLDKASHVEDIGVDEQCVHENNPWMNKKDGEHKEFVNGYNVFCDQHKLRKTKDQEKLDKTSHVEDIGDDEQCVHENNPWMNKKDGEHKEFVNGYNVFCDQHKLRKTKDQEKLDKASHVEDIGDDEQCVHENNPWMNKKDGEHKEFVNGYNVFCDQHKLRKTKDQGKLDKASHVEDIGDDEQCVHENNPWMNKKDGEHKKFVNGYNVFCDQHKLRKTKDQGKLDKASYVEDNKGFESSSHVSNGLARDESEERVSLEKASGRNIIGTTKNGFLITDNKYNPVAGIRQTKLSKLKSFNRSWKCYEMKFESSNQLKEPGSSVSERLSGLQDFDYVFENMELFLKNKFVKRASLIESQIEAIVTQQLKSNKTEKPISFLNGSRVLDMLNIDEKTASDPSQEVKTSSGIMDSNTTLQNISTCETSRVDNDAIDPKNIIHIFESKLNTEIPVITEIDNNSEDEEAINNHMTIADAFTDDDVVAEFGLEKEANSEKDRPAEVFNMPGWGEWTGKGLPSFSRMNGFYTPCMSRPRKDEKKERLIIKEGADSPAKIHRVNELPFPFTSVERYEANIRAPLGSTWIPETAHRKLIAPKVSTKMGEAIEPISETVLIDLTDKNVEIDEI